MKTYIIPALQVSEAQVTGMMALSLKSEKADPNAEVLTKENNDWNIWEDSD